MPTGQPSPTRDQERSVGDLADLAKTIIKIVALSFGATFGYLSLKDTPLNRIGEVFDGGSLIVVALCLYFSGWVIGAGADTRIQEQALGVDPDLGKLGRREWFGIGCFVALLFSVFAFHAYHILFQCLLTAFICVNVWTWRIILRRTRRMIEETATKLARSRDTYAYLKLAIMTEYMNGSWQRRRFAVLIAFAAIQIPIAILDQMGRLNAVIGGLTFAGISGAALANYATGILFMLWVIASELWMKIYRIKFYSDMKLLDFMADHIELHRRNATPLPPMNLKPLRDFSKSINRNYA